MTELLNTNAQPSRLAPDRRLFVGGAIAIAVIVFVGFARTYFLKLWYDTPALPWLVHVHGAVMTAWFLLFFGQTCLIARHRADLHRVLGAIGAALIVVMVVLGMVVVAHAAAREVHAHAKDAAFFLMLLALDPFMLLVFAALAASAIAMRNRRSDLHKRLMLLATLSLTLFAIGRLPFPSEAIAWLVYALCLVVPVIIDTVSNHRLHPAFGWGAPAVFISLYLVRQLATTPAWIHFAQRLVS
jgi:hypothetical protein